MLAVESDAVVGPEAVDDLELLSEHLPPDLQLGEGKAERLVLAFHPAGAEAELDPPAGDVIGGRDRVREYRRRPKRHRGYERAESQGRGARREAGEDRPRVVRDVGELVGLGDVV